MKKFTFPILFAFLFLGASCENSFSNQPAPAQPKPIEVSAKTAQLIQNNNQFGLDLFKEIASQEHGDTNVMISPLSATLALAMTYNGAAGTTKTAFENTFHLNGLTASEINQSMYDLCNALTGADPQVTFDLANSIWFKKGFPVEQDFLTTNQKYYDAEVDSLNFSDSNSVNIINNWVNKNTNGKIPSIVNQINPTDVMFLINATYFKGNWTSKFDPAKTKNEAFTLQNGTVKQVPTMSQETEMGYLSNDLFTAVELPYGRGNFSMILFLPNPNKTLADVENAMNQTNWQHWTDSLNNETKMFVYLPKFKFEFSQIMNNDLANLGLGIAFTDSANFSNINPTAPLLITQVKQKTYINVDEEGTEAAAATSVTVGLTSVFTNSVSFNRPFLFAIKEKYTNAILFIGCVMDPSEN